MTSGTHEQVLIVLNVLPGLEEAVVDWLLGREGAGGFTSSPAHGHSTRHGGLSIVEQVRARRNRTRFEIHMHRDEARDFLGQALEEFGAADVHVMVLPVTAAGSLQDVLAALD